LAIKGRNERWGYLGAALSGLILVSAFPKADMGWLAWFALVPYLSAFPHARLRAAVGQSSVFVSVFIGAGLYWIWLFAAHTVGYWLGSIAWIGAIVTQGAAYLVFACGAHWLGRARSPWFYRLGAPCLWTALEWARQFGTFGSGWGDLAYTQYRTIDILQVTKLTGVWGLSFLIVLVNVALAEWARPWVRSLLRASVIDRAGKSGWFIAGTASLAAACLVYGALVARGEPARGQVVVAALQGNFSEDEQVTPAYIADVLSAYSAQECEAARRGAVLSVWPETALPGYLRLDSSFGLPITTDALNLRQAQLVGDTDRNLADNRDQNVLIFVSSRGSIGSEYVKIHLMPFGEYIPLGRQFPWLRKLHLYIYDLDPGPPDQPLIDTGAPIGKIGTAICFDSTFGGLLRDQTARGARLLVVSTNDSWYGMTAAARQHAAFSSVRACECDRFLVRCAATGVSQIIDPSGRVRAQMPVFQRAVLIGNVEPRATRTLYVRWGDWFAFLCLAALAAMSCLRLRCSPAAMM
jgi:apolipoprotein N-acyltransferase